MSSRSCAICKRPKIRRMEIEERIAKGESLETIATWDGSFTAQQLQHHRREQHNNQNALSKIGDRYHPAYPYMVDLDIVTEQLMDILSIFITDTDDNGKIRQVSLRDAISCLRELRMVTEAKAKLAGAYDTHPVGDSPAFQRLATLMTAFVVKRPELKDDILTLLDEAKYGDKQQ